jgi:Flp pilus assembly pilin Flp
MQRIHRRWRAQRGAVAVEFALIMPVLVLLVVGTIEFGRVWSQYQVFNGAAREGARCAAVKAGGFATCDIQGRIVSAAGPYANDLPASRPVTINGVSAPAGCTNATRGQDVRVSWVQPLRINIPTSDGPSRSSARW